MRCQFRLGAAHWRPAGSGRFGRASDPHASDGSGAMVGATSIGTDYSNPILRALTWTIADFSQLTHGAHTRLPGADSERGGSSYADLGDAKFIETNLTAEARTTDQLIDWSTAVSAGHVLTSVSSCSMRN